VLLKFLFARGGILPRAARHARQRETYLDRRDPRAPRHVRTWRARPGETWAAAGGLGAAPADEAGKISLADTKTHTKMTVGAWGAGAGPGLAAAPRITELQ
jgi:hypothetical protein